jgi:hypothetical protein
VRVEVRFAHDRVPGVEPLVADSYADGPGAVEYDLRSTPEAVMLAAAAFDPETVAAPRFVVRWQIVNVPMTETIVPAEPAARVA